MRKKIIEIVENLTFENQSKIARWILTHYGKAIFHTHKNGCSINLDIVSDEIIKKIYDYVCEIHD